MHVGANTWDTVASFVPDLAGARLFPEAEGAAAASFDGVVLQADLSGFTRLAETYAQEGPDGAERLSARLNELFGEIVDLVVAHGGDVASFAGDALLAVWPAGAEHPAAAAARAAQRVVNERARADGVRMRIGLAAGPIGVLRLGGVGGRWEIVVVGPAVRRAAELERKAPAGSVLFDDAVASALQRERFVPPPLVPPERQDGVVARATAFVPRQVVARIEAGQGGWLAELRTVTALFAALPRFDTEDPAHAQDIVTTAQRLIYDLDGSVVRLVVDNKGPLLFAAFGLPPVSTRDDAVRAVAAARGIAAALGARGERAAVGVATGRVFSGTLGSERRRDHTLLGGPVNLAARLMQHAIPLEPVLCDEATRSAARHGVRFGPARDLELRGLSRPVAVAAPVELVSDGEDHGELVGRHAELRALSELLDAGGAGVVCGESGIGKSRLLGAFLASAGRRGRRALLGAGDPLRRSTPYATWRGVMRGLLGADVRALGRRLIDLGIEDLDAAALLAGPLDLAIPATERTAGLTPAEHAERTATLAAEVVAAAAARTPLAVVLDDVQWMDSASWALARRVAREGADVALVVGHRPGEAAAGEAEALGPRVRITLGALDAGEAEALIASALGVDAVPAELARFVHERAAGHPFFCLELLLSLLDHDAVRLDGDTAMLPGGTEALAALELPTTVAGVVTGRIERLSHDEQLTLKVASVVGQSFPAPVVAAAHPLDDARPRVPAVLEGLTAPGLEVLEHAGRQAYAFGHAITREVAYELLTYGQRRELHAAIASGYEASAPRERAPAATVALHWERAGRPDRAHPHLAAAAREALMAGAFREAADLSERAIAAAEGRTDPLTLAGVLALAGQAHSHLGDVEESLARHRRALELTGEPLPASTPGAAARVTAELTRQAARRLGVTRPRRAIGDAATARRLACESLGDVEQVAYFQDDLATVTYCTSRATNILEELDDAPQLARNYAGLGSIAGFAGLHGVARSYIRRCDEVVARGVPLVDRGLANEFTTFYLQSIGDWDEAERRARDGLAQLQEAGHTRRSLECVSMLAWILDAGRGRTDEAAALREDYLGRARRSGDRQMMGGMLCALAVLRVHQGRPAEAPPLLDEADEVVVGRSDQVFRLAVRALVHLRLGEHEAAIAAGRQARATMGLTAPPLFYLGEPLAALAEAARVSGDRRWYAQAVRQLDWFSRSFPVARPLALLWRGHRDADRGRHAQARRRWEAGLAIARELSLEREVRELEAVLSRPPATGRRSAGA